MRIVFLFCIILFLVPALVRGQDLLPEEVPCDPCAYLSQVLMHQQSQLLYLERQFELLEVLNLLSQYQLGLLAYLSGVFSAFVFLYGLRLR